MADQQSTSDRARRVQQFISQARQGDGGMRAWLARRAQVMQARTNEAALAKARGDQQQALRAAMATPGALQLAESTQPGAATGGPAPIAPRQPTTPGPTPAGVARGFSSAPGQVQTMGPVASGPVSAPASVANPSPFASLRDPTMAPMIPRNLGGSMAVDFAGFDEGGNPKDTAGGFMSPPPGIDPISWRVALTQQIQRSADPAGFDAQQQAQAQSRNAYQVARDAAQGQMLPGSFGANGVDYGQAQADPSAALRAFDASGYTEQQALADGWGTGVGTPGWQSTPPSQQLNPNGGNMAAMAPSAGPAMTANNAQRYQAQPVTQSNAQQYPAATPQIATQTPAQQYPTATQAPTVTVPVATQAPAAVAPTASANPSANLAAAIQRSNAPAAPAAPRTAVPPAYRAAPGPVAPPTTPAAPAAPRANDDDVRNALTAQPRASGAMPRMPGSRVGLG